MKRVIAILLTLLLWLPMIGCKAFVPTAAKNYTVKEVDGEKRIFLNQDEIDRIEKEVAEKGWSVTELKGFSSLEESNAAQDYPNSPAESFMFGKNGNLVAKCRVSDVKTIQMSHISDPDEKVGKSGFVTVYDLVIEKVFYTEKGEKEGDTIRYLFSNHPSFGSDSCYANMIAGEGFTVSTLYSLIPPPEKGSFYVIAKKFTPDYEPNSNKATEACSDYRNLTHYGIILNPEGNRYYFHPWLESLSEDAYYLPKEDVQYDMWMCLETDDFDARLQAVVDKYKNP